MPTAIHPVVRNPLIPSAQVPHPCLSDGLKAAGIRRQSCRCCDQNGAAAIGRSSRPSAVDPVLQLLQRRKSNRNIVCRIQTDRLFQHFAAVPNRYARMVDSSRGHTAFIEDFIVALPRPDTVRIRRIADRCDVKTDVAIIVVVHIWQVVAECRKRLDQANVRLITVATDRGCQGARSLRHQPQEIVFRAYWQLDVFIAHPINLQNDRPRHVAGPFRNPRHNGTVAINRLMGPGIGETESEQPLVPQTIKDHRTLIIRQLRKRQFRFRNRNGLTAGLR